MTTPRDMGRVSDALRRAIPFMRNRLTQDEQTLGVHLRGNADLHAALMRLIQTRIETRATVQEPSDPVACKSMVARDRELQWLKTRLNFIFQSPVHEPALDSEPPA